MNELPSNDPSLSASGQTAAVKSLNLKPPPFLLGAVLLFWGYYSEFMIAGSVMAVILESTLILKDRWNFADEDFTRIWTFCSLLLLAATIYVFTANDTASTVLGFLQNPNYFTQRNAGNSSARAVAGLLQWLPMIFFPFIAASRFSTREGVPLRTISLILQRRWKKTKERGEPVPPSSSVNISYAFYGLCLFSASIHTSENTTFFWGLSALLAWGLWPLRSKRFSLVTWACALTSAIFFGYFGQKAISEVQRYVGGLNPSWLSSYSRRGFDARQTRTMIGHVGRNKLSGNIVIRVESRGGLQVPTLLREATYRFYKAAFWYSGFGRNDFENISPETTNQTLWVLGPPRETSARVNISCYLPGGTGLLPLPKGSARLEQLPAFVLHKNGLGAVLAEGPNLVIFDACYGPGTSLDSDPAEGDADGVSRREAAALEQVIWDMQVRGQSLDQTLRTIKDYFAKNFTYSMWQEASSNTNSTPLGRFLLKSRSGHCEYFATATVLLLRELGFAARYAVGYAVHEPAGEGKYVVRQRDGHAWCVVWKDGRWQDFDTTPSSWFQVEAERASKFQKISDLFSRISFEISKVRWGQSHLRKFFLMALVPILVLLLYQILFRTRRQRLSAKRGVKVRPEWPGLDSDFYEVEKILGARGFVRGPSESLSSWLTRAIADSALNELKSSLEKLLQLHYRYRFDPKGITGADRMALRKLTQDCVRAISQTPVASI